MKLTTDQIIAIKKDFALMECKDDFLFLLNKVKHYLYGDKVIFFTIKQLNYYINKESLRYIEDKSYGNRFYHAFKIKKKSGKEREIHAPIRGLKEFQKVINVILQSVYNPHESATGFVLGKSIADNAQKHINQNYVYNLDLKDFFPSIDKRMVYIRLLNSPFNLGDSNGKSAIANMIAVLCCHRMKTERFEEKQWITKELMILPQGAPTSPTITNAICEKLDRRLNGVAKRFGLNYSRYADDITFSSLHNFFVSEGNEERIFCPESTFDREVRRIIGEMKFHVNEQKVRLQKKGYRQEVTGLTVNDKINVSRRYIKQMRQWLYYWETYGYERAYSLFLKKYMADKGHLQKGHPNMVMVLEGKLLYLKMIKGEKDTTYLGLRNRLDDLVITDKSKKINQVTEKDTANIVDLIHDKGLEEAMKYYDVKI